MFIVGTGEGELRLRDEDWRMTVSARRHDEEMSADGKGR